MSLWKVHQRLAVIALSAILITSCGGGSNSTGSAGAGTSAAATQVNRPQSEEEAARFLAQATFGPKNKAEIDNLMKIGYDAWFEEQFKAPSSSYDKWYQNLDTSRIGETNPNISGFYTYAVKGDDQLRQRMTWALSQIFVVSDRTGPLSLQPSIGVNAYLDVLRSNAFATYRTLLDEVTYSAVMAVYLTYLGNERENYASANSIPDNNYAREIMQLFSIGLYELNQDGSQKLVNGQPVATYNANDIFGLSKVFTGFTYASSSDPDTIPAGAGKSRDNAFRERMGFDKNRHSTSEKKFLGKTIAATATSQPIADVKAALDIISDHPNVGPYIGRQLIQRFVTSNPSPAYVSRVAGVFNNNGAGVRGDLKAVIKAILLDPEARDRSKLNDSTWGKVREPVLANIQIMRMLNANSFIEGSIMLNRNSNCLFDWNRMIFVRAQAPAYAATVFNYYRPNFTPPASDLAAKGLAAAEFQILDTTSLTEWTKYVVDMFDRDGTGATPGQPCDSAANRFDYSELTPLAGDPKQLVDRISLLLTADGFSPSREAQLVKAVSAATGKDDATLRRNRIRLALTLVMLSPEYLVQK